MDAIFDQIVGWFKGFKTPSDPDYMPPSKALRFYHFTIGKPGEEISGGIYIKLNTPLPKQLIIDIPNPWK